MSAVYQQHLRTLAYRLADLGALVASATAHATRALLNADRELADHVLVQDAEASGALACIEEQANHLLEQPAPDLSCLRALVVGVRVGDDLRRMGELPRQVADRARSRCPEVAVPAETHALFAHLGGLSVVAAHEIQRIVAEPERARYAELDRAIGIIADTGRELAASVGPGWAHGVRAGVDVTQLAGAFGRFAGHAAALARRVDHLISGMPCSN